MAVEEPSVIAAVSFAAKLTREGGGFVAEADEPIMIAQIQISRFGDAHQARSSLLSHREELLALANSFHPSMVQRGGGAKDIEVRLLDAPEGPAGEPILVLHLLIDTRDAMGANLVNTAAEGVAPLVEQITGGKVYLRILSNLSDRRMARASCQIPLQKLSDQPQGGEEVAQIAEGVVQASRFAQADPYRATTHNKGIMNGIDAVAIATGNDWRAIEAGAHAFAARNGRYQPLSHWVVEGDNLCGRIEMPLAVGILGGSMKVHPHMRLAHKILGAESARELAAIMAAVGLAQNFAALRALGSVGIQKGHMARHARCVAVQAGARGDQIQQIAQAMAKEGSIGIDRARKLLHYSNNTSTDSKET
jgi:hydroxymethylglutaryl-CoA reductase